LLVGLSVAVATVALLVPWVAVLLARYPALRRPSGWSARLRERNRVLAFLAAVVLLKTLLADLAEPVSWLIGRNVTDLIYGIEGNAVAAVQSIATPPLTTYFAFVYIHAFTFLLVFPVVAYVALPDPRPLRETAVAYSLNYLLGLVAYAAFVAYGPRNYVPETVSSLLYVHWPEAYLLTGSMNANSNVFPSLHVSFAVTAALLARRTRSDLPLWWPVAAGFAASVAVATVYLGIHWLTDAVAGAVLGAACVRVAARDPLVHLDPILRRALARARGLASR
jgi:membrane-associated phospholipid phosphatase